MKTINIQTPNKTYPIIISDNYDGLKAFLQEQNYSKIGIISDSNVFPLHGEALQSICESVNSEVYAYSFEAGESSKHLETIKEMYGFLVDAKMDRKSVLLALGGGVTGDMTGYLAATFMRGIHYIQIPTSLLAQVDSSVGGKTGVDFMGYKNIVGAFYQPDLVFMNTKTLNTLPELQFSSGMGEVIKHGCILDRSYLQTLIDDVQLIRGMDHEALTKMISRSCEIKSDIVNQDEKEMGVRALLNFGHTFGHAIERKRYETHSHGACVAIGMVAATKLSVELGHISQEDMDLIISTIEAYDLPTSVEGLTVEEVYLDMFLDKKTSHNTLKLVLLKSVGAAYITSEVIETKIKEAISYVLV